MERKHNLYLSKSEEQNQDFIVEHASISKYRTLRVHFLLSQTSYSNYYDIIIPKPDLFFSKNKPYRNNNQDKDDYSQDINKNYKNYNSNCNQIDEAFRNNKVFFENMIDLISEFTLKISFKGTIQKYITSQGRQIKDFELFL